ncbi:hypothetical protein EIP91_000315 [Steccherinum ochraceum]|uniref:Uncharacterized protein n=1 Tax=Steccherinum ochraceum TaxID=92696 RepID=A0A4R0RJJ1_9APHY|nr:hypothetical protein EIP91_000315 [Steccherinum ochraceum]
MRRIKVDMQKTRRVVSLWPETKGRQGFRTGDLLCTLLANTSFGFVAGLKMAARAAASKVSPPPPFSALLRRSKFATHDPKISQVYMSHGGDAYRGNYGFKRPIPYRKRQAHITVSEVDSRESQTVWENAEQPARWMKMWDEVSVDVDLDIQSQWYKGLGSSGELSASRLDSEFSRLPLTAEELAKKARTQKEEEAAEEEAGMKEEEMDEETRLKKEADALARIYSNDVLNINAMGEKKFEAYLDKLRKLRPLFKRYIQAGEALYRPGKEPRSPYEMVQVSETLATRFLAARMQRQYYSSESALIEQAPHYSAGLSYARSSSFQDMFARRPQPGRVLNHRPNGSARQMIVSFAGMTTELTADKAERKMLDFLQLARSGTREVGAEVSRFKAQRSVLRHVPQVVGAQATGPRRSILNGASIMTTVKEVGEQVPETGNHYRPGSKEYNSCREGVPNEVPIHRPRVSDYSTPGVVVGESKVHTDQVMDNLQQMV